MFIEFFEAELKCYYFKLLLCHWLVTYMLQYFSLQYKSGNSSTIRNEDFVGNPHDVTSPCSDLSRDSPRANGENKSKKDGDPEIGERMDCDDDDDDEDGGGCGCEGMRQFVPSYPGSILVEEMIKRLVEQQQQLLHLHGDSNFPLETFLANVQGILRLSADNARYMERKFTYEKGKMSNIVDADKF